MEDQIIENQEKILKELIMKLSFITALIFTLCTIDYIINFT